MNAARNLALTAITEAASLSLEMCAKQQPHMAALKRSLRTDAERAMFDALERSIEAHRSLAEGVAAFAAQAVDGGRAS